MLHLTVYRRMFSKNLTTDGLPKPDTLQAADDIILESYTDGMLPIHRIAILKVAHYKTGKLMLIRFFIVHTKK